METLNSVEPLPFGSLGTRRKRVTLTVVHTLSGSAAFVSLSSRMTLIALARRIAPFGCWRSARARHEPRRPPVLVRFGGLARLCLEASYHLRLGLRACSSVG